MNNILIFGTTGELGSRVASQCVQKGYNVTGVSRGLNQRHYVPLEGVEIITGDKGDESLYRDKLANMKWDAVIDTVPEEEHIALVEKYFNGKIDHYIICSSAGTYTPFVTFPVGEEHPWEDEPEGERYNELKRRDKNAFKYYKEKDFPVTILRPSNIIGRGRSPFTLWGDRDINFYKDIKAGKNIDIPESPYLLIQSGTNEDLASAFVGAVEKGSEICGKAYILSSKRAVTFKDFFECVKEFFGSSSKARYVPRDEFVKRLPDESAVYWLDFLLFPTIFDISAAEKDLDYKPMFTTLQGLREALEWCREENLF